MIADILFIYLFPYSPTIDTFTGYLTIAKLNTKGRKVIVEGFLNKVSGGAWVQPQVS